MAGSPFARFNWLSNPYKPGIGQAFEVAFSAGLAAYTAGFAREVEAYAKENAPWEDRSGDARDGLTAKGFQRLTQYVIQLYHTVDYGLYLEVRWGGRYAIIIPTIEVMGHELMDRLEMAILLKGFAP